MVNPRRLSAFKVCAFGEGRIYTKPKVTDVSHYFGKAGLFESSIYDPEHREMAGFMPGFNLIEIAGAPLKVVGVVNKEGSLEQLESVRASPDQICKHFLLDIL